MGHVLEPSSLISRAWPSVRRYLDLITLGLLLALLLLSNWLPVPGLGKGAPGGIVGLGIAHGAGLSLQAIGMVLILRSNRIINFAQAQLGALTGVIFFELVRHNQLVLLAYVACGSCFKGLPADTSFLASSPHDFLTALQGHGYTGWMIANFWVSLVFALLLAPLISWLVYVLIIRRFETAPRLIVTVVTVAIAQVLVSLTGLLPGIVFSDQRIDSTFYSPLPNLTLALPKAFVHTSDVLAVAVALLVGTAAAAFFLLSRTGVTMRAAADNPRRAETLGISVGRLSSLSWVAAGAVSGIAAILDVLANSGGGGQGLLQFRASTLVEILAAVVLARLVSLPLAVFGAIALGIINQVFFWNYSSPVPYQAALLVIIGAALLLQQSRQSRAEVEATAGYLSAREARPIPRELRDLPVVEGAKRWFALVVAVLVLGYPFVMPPEQVSLGSVVLIFAVILLSLMVLTGWAGQISLGQFAFAAVGGYVAVFLGAKLGLFFLLALLGGGLAGAVVAVVVGVPALRLRGMYLAVTTLAFALATTSILLNSAYLGKYLPSGLDRPVFLGFELSDERVFYYVSLLFVVLAVAALAGLRRSRTARALIACRDNEQAAQSFGINLFRARLEAFAISGFLAALAGGLFAYHEHGLEPSAFAAEQSLNMFSLVVIGGTGSLLGPLLGATYGGVFRLFSDPLIQFLGTGFGVLMILMIFPGGLGAMAYAARDAWLRRIAIRYRLIVPSLLADVREDALENEAPIAPRTDRGGGTELVPPRYRLEGQWDHFAEDATVG